MRDGVCRSLLAVALGFALTGIVAGAGEIPGRMIGRGATIQPAPGAPTPADRVSVLVELAPGADRGRFRDVVRSLGGRVHREYSLLPNVVNLRDVPKAALAGLERAAGVRRVEPDRPIGLHLNQSTPLINALESQVSAVHPGTDGGGVRVCVIDTGINPDHAMFDTRVDMAAALDLVENDGDPRDDHGHGTHVAGIALGGDGNTIDFGCPEGVQPFQGVAWEATVVPVKVVACCGLGSESNLIAGIEHCVDQSPSGGRADVINVSLGTDVTFQGSCDGDLVAQAANAAVDAGVVFVSSSGNLGESNGMSSPACASKAIAVGATWDATYPNCEWIYPSCWNFCFDAACLTGCQDCNPKEDDITCFSNKGSEIDVVAPGCVTTSADFESAVGSVFNCGTSMAAPHVAGVAALLLSGKPSMSPAQVRDAIRNGAIDLGAPGPDSTYGYGRVDAIGALGSLGCSADADCNDGNTCTSDTCDLTTKTCTFTPPSCGPTDGCCPAGCTISTDADCCGGSGTGCNSDSQCCSGRCKGKPGAKTCS